MINAFPLHWPGGWPRTLPQRRTRARFGKGQRHQSPMNDGTSWTHRRELTVTDGVDRILSELSRMGIDRHDIVISTNVRLRLDGLPRSGEREPEDPGVAVFWTDIFNERAPRCMAIDLYDRVADNLGAVAATIDAMRSIERHGGAQILARAFKGFVALPAPGQTSRGWREVFEYPNGSKLTLAQIEDQHKRLRSRYHPDRPGGDAEKFHEVQKAYEQACAELRA